MSYNTGQPILQLQRLMKGYFALMDLLLITLEKNLKYEHFGLPDMSL